MPSGRGDVEGAYSPTCLAARRCQDLRWFYRQPLFLSQEFNYARSEEHTSELQSLMRNSYAVFCLKKKIKQKNNKKKHQHIAHEYITRTNYSNKNIMIE